MVEIQKAKLNDHYLVYTGSYIVYNTIARSSAWRQFKRIYQDVLSFELTSSVKWRHFELLISMLEWFDIEALKLGWLYPRRFWARILHTVTTRYLQYRCRVLSILVVDWETAYY